MTKSRDIHISQDNKIFINGVYKGFIDDETAYIIERDHSRPLGTFDHRSEVIAMVVEWSNGHR